MPDEGNLFCSRNKLVPFTANVFRVLEGVIEPVLRPIHDRYSWSCVRMMDITECDALGIAAPAVELRPLEAIEKHVVRRYGDRLVLQNRVELIRAASHRGIEASPERDGFHFTQLRKILLRSHDELRLDIPRKAELMLRMVPGWSGISLEGKYAQRFVQVPEGYMLFPENEVNQTHRFQIMLQIEKPRYGEPRRTIQIRSLPLAWQEGASTDPYPAA